MSKKQEAVQLALAMARDPAHGYDQSSRWGPDFDCSSFLIHVWEQVGVPLKSAGASYTGNMKAAALAVGFNDVTERVNLQSGSGLQISDILLNEKSHAAMFAGNGELVHASINELGTTTGGRPGDQTGREICVRSYYNGGWDCVLRYSAEDEPVKPEAKPVGKPDELPVLRHGSRGLSVLAMQAVLIVRGFDCGPDGADGVFGDNTEKALKAFQEECRIDADGICGPVTWACLLGVM